MLKKITRLIRTSIIGIVWTYIFIIIANSELVAVWNFNLLSERSWKTINTFWQAGGVIKSSPDYLFFFNLAIIPVIWILGWRFLLRQNYFSLLILPFTVYNKYIIKNLKKQPSFALKNIGGTNNEVEKIKNEIDSIKPEKPKEVLDIRQTIQKKITSASEKK